VVFEFDVIKGHNLNRILHARRRDAAAKRSKGERLKEALNETELGNEITIIEEGDITNEKIALKLRGCDFIFGCVDNQDWPRLVMTEVAYQYLIPYIDLGTEIGIDDLGVQSLEWRKSKKIVSSVVTSMKSPRFKVKSILTILFVVTKYLLHGRNKVDCLHLRERSFNAAVLGEIGKHLYAEYHMPSPALLAYQLARY